MRKYLEGELVWREGVAGTGNLIRTLGEQLATGNWAIVPQKGTNLPWAFDINREIVLPDPVKKEDVRLYRGIAETEIIPLGNPTGVITFFKKPESSGVLNIIVNQSNFTIPFTADDEILDLMNRVVATISSNEDFSDTEVLDANKMKIYGAEPIYELEVIDFGINSHNHITESSISTQTVRSNVLQITAEPFISENTTASITIDGIQVSFPLEEGINRNEIATKIAQAVVRDTPYKLTTATDNAITILGTQNPTSISANEIISSFIGLRTSVTAEGDGITSVLNDSLDEGVVSITATRGDSSVVTATVTVVKDETKESVAQKLATRMIAEWGGSHVVEPGSSTIISRLGAGQNFQSLTSPFSISNSAKYAMTRTIGPNRNWGTIKLLTTGPENQTINVSVNASTFNIPTFTFETPEAILEKIKVQIASDEDYAYTTVFENEVFIYGNQDINLLSLNTDVPKMPLVVRTEISRPTKTNASINFTRGIYRDSENLFLILNGKAYSVAVTNLMSAEQLATEVANSLKTFDGFLDTAVSETNLTEVIVAGTESILDCVVEPIQLNDDSFEVFGNSIRGISTGDVGTQVGDNVIIKSNRSNVVFDFVTIEKTTNLYGGDVAYANLKSRPRGEARVFEAVLYSFVEEVSSPDRQTFNLGASIIVDNDSEKLSVKILVEVDGQMERVEANPEDYLVDEFNGVIYFKKPVDSSIIVEGKYIDPISVGDEIPVANYKIMDNVIIDTTPDLELTGKSLVVTVDYSWTLAYPASFNTLDPESPRCILRTSIDISPNLGRGQLKNFFVEFRTPTDPQDALTGIEIRYGDRLDPSSSSTLDSNFASSWVRVSWLAKEGLLNGELSISKISPVMFDMNYTSEYINIVLQGDPALDPSYSNYQISPVHIGLLEEYDGVDNVNRERKFVLTGGSDILPTYNDRWGKRSGNGNTDIIAFRTNTNLPFQSYTVGFYSGPEFMDKHYIGPSVSTEKYHFSEISVTHSVEREIGKISSVIVGDRSAIFHRDELTSHRDVFNAHGALLDENGKFVDNRKTSLVISQEKQWKMFNIKSNFWYGNKSPNIFYGIALRTR